MNISTSWIMDKINGITPNHTYPCNTTNYSNSASREINYIVIHYTGNAKDSALSNVKYFQTGGRKASAHFFVDDTNIYQSVELRDSAWSIGCSIGYKTNARNANSISIEMCTSGSYNVSEKTQVNSAYLCANLCKRLGITANAVDKYVLRHYDCVKSNKACPKQYVTNSAQWTQFKTWVKNILTTGSHKNVISLVKDGVDYSRVLDTNYYADHNADLKNAFGYDATKLFNHFLVSGCKEKSRWGKTIATFNVEVYASHSADLVKAYGALGDGSNGLAFYKHYCTNGYKENRRCI